MYVKKIELEDIKSYTEAKFEFNPGTTAITGKNGAGKTTLIEVIAWTLFDLLDYKKIDFVRRGAKKGVARVTFESGLDQRVYTVHRNTNTGYYVYDPRLKIRIAEKKEEVKRFLWTHLGVEAGTDLESLFRSAIGVPQGTFTAIFLETPSLRKKAFDKLLKVDEYRQSADKLRETAKYIERKIVAGREEIAHAEGALGGFDQLETNLKSKKKEIKKLNTQIREIEVKILEKKKIVAEFERVEAKISKQKDIVDKLISEKSKTEIVLSQKEIDRALAEKATLKIKEVKSGYEDHLKALKILKELELKRASRENLRSELAKAETAIASVKAEKKANDKELEKIVSAQKEIESLKPKLQKQKDLDRKKEKLRNQLTEAKYAQTQVKNLDEKIKKLRTRYRENRLNKTEAEKKSAEAKYLEERQQHDDEIQKDLATLRAKLESDKAFQNEIKNGLCPILSEKCLNLKEGQTLEDFVATQFADVSAKIDKLRLKKNHVSVLLNSSRKAEKFLVKLDGFIKREEEILKEVVGYKKEKEILEQNAKKIGNFEKELDKIEITLKNLDNPKARFQLLEKEIVHQPLAREKASAIESNFARLEKDCRLKIEQLKKYEDLDPNLKRFTSLRESTSEAHREFVANESLAKSLEEKRNELEIVKSKFNEIKQNLKQAENILETANEGFDLEIYTSEKHKLADLEKQLVEVSLSHKHLISLEFELEDEIKRLKEIRISLEEKIKGKKRLEKIEEITEFIRSTLKEAAPHVARNYVYHVSVEANHMFREIIGNAEQTLKWTEDYGISLEEKGCERPFQNLSGGEKMAAALSVRLALLKQLSDVRIAFFDEPTTNMDAERRERLAEQISRITEKQTFDQLLVISHDDTFEEYVDDVIII